MSDEASVRHLNHHQQLAKSEASFDARTMINGLRSRKAYKDLAQGFSPGLGVFNAICPVGAPGTPFEGCSWKHAQSRRKQTWRPFRACRVNCGNPGLKPWAQSCFPFGEHKARCQTPNANSSDDVSAIALAKAEALGVSDGAAKPERQTRHGDRRILYPHEF